MIQVNKIDAQNENLKQNNVLVNSLLDHNQQLTKQIEETNTKIDYIGDNVEAIHSKLDKRIFYQEESKSMDNESVAPDEVVFEEEKNETKEYFRGDSKNLEQVFDYLKSGNDELESKLGAYTQYYSLDDSMAQE